MSKKYKVKYEVIWQNDLSFSRKFMPEILDILGRIDFQDVVIRNNEGTKLDSQGSDLTILPSKSLQIGVRVRRNYAVKWDQFTQDDKERTTMNCDVYFLGYADEEERHLLSYMIWNGNEYAMKRDDGTIPLASREQNERHGRVPFNCYYNSDIAKCCHVYVKVGDIASQPGIAECHPQLF
jgi:hypothetical protein